MTQPGLILVGLPQNKWTDKARVLIMNIDMQWHFEFAPEGVHPNHPDPRYRCIPTLWWLEPDGVRIVLASGIEAIEDLANEGILKSEASIRTYLGCEKMKPMKREERVGPDFEKFAKQLEEEAEFLAMVHKDDNDPRRGTGQSASDQRMLRRLATKVRWVQKHLGY